MLLFLSSKGFALKETLGGKVIQNVDVLTPFNYYINGELFSAYIVRISTGGAVDNVARSSINVLNAGLTSEIAARIAGDAAGVLAYLKQDGTGNKSATVTSSFTASGLSISTITFRSSEGKPVLGNRGNDFSLYYSTPALKTSTSPMLTMVSAPINSTNTWRLLDFVVAETTGANENFPNYDMNTNDFWEIPDGTTLGYATTGSYQPNIQAGYNDGAGYSGGSGTRALWLKGYDLRYTTMSYTYLRTPQLWLFIYDESGNKIVTNRVVGASANPIDPPVNNPPNGVYNICYATIPVAYINKKIRMEFVGGDFGQIDVSTFLPHVYRDVAVWSQARSQLFTTNGNRISFYWQWRGYDNAFWNGYSEFFIDFIHGGFNNYEVPIGIAYQKSHPVVGDAIVMHKDGKPKLYVTDEGVYTGTVRSTDSFATAYNGALNGQASYSTYTYNLAGGTSFYYARYDEVKTSTEALYAMIQATRAAQITSDIAIGQTTGYLLGQYNANASTDTSQWSYLYKLTLDTTTEASQRQLLANATGWFLKQDGYNNNNNSVTVGSITTNIIYIPYTGGTYGLICSKLFAAADSANYIYIPTDNLRITGGSLEVYNGGLYTNNIYHSPSGGSSIGINDNVSMTGNITFVSGDIIGSSKLDASYNWFGSSSPKYSSSYEWYSSSSNKYSMGYEWFVSSSNKYSDSYSAYSTSSPFYSEGYSVLSSSSNKWSVAISSLAVLWDTPRSTSAISLISFATGYFIIQDKLNGRNSSVTVGTATFNGGLITVIDATANSTPRTILRNDAMGFMIQINGGDSDKVQFLDTVDFNTFFEYQNNVHTKLGVAETDTYIRGTVHFTKYITDPVTIRSSITVLGVNGNSVGIPGTHTTGAAVPSMGTNAPIVTDTPYAWVKVDVGTATCYMPVWK